MFLFRFSNDVFYIFIFSFQTKSKVYSFSFSIYPINKLLKTSLENPVKYNRLFLQSVYEPPIRREKRRRSCGGFLYLCSLYLGGEAGDPNGVGENVPLERTLLIHSSENKHIYRFSTQSFLCFCFFLSIINQ